MHAVGIHDPRHGLLVGVDVRGGHVFFRAEDIDHLRRVTAGHALQLSLAHLLGVADHAALGPAERNVHHGALPRHPACQSANFVQVYVRRVANAAFCRSARHGVLHPKSGKDLDAAVIHHHGKVDNDLSRGLPQHLPDAGVQIQFLCRKIKAGGLRLPRVQLFFDCMCQRVLHASLFQLQYCHTTRLAFLLVARWASPPGKRHRVTLLLDAVPTASMRRCGEV